MDEKEELKIELEQELQWSQYRQKMLVIIEDKLFEMRRIAEQAKQGNLTSEKLEVLNARLNNLATQVKALDGESTKGEYGKVMR